MAMVLGGAAVGQQVTVLLRDPSGAPVADAVGSLRSSAQFGYAALPEDLPPRFADVVPHDRWLTARSDGRGVLQFRAGEGQHLGAGSGMVVTEPGLGALLPRLQPGRAERVVLQPLAAVTTATGSEVFTLLARATLADGSRLTLPPRTGSEVRLPAGDYEVWAQAADGWTWQRLELQAGGRALLTFTGEALRLRPIAGALVHPEGRVDVDLGRVVDGAPAANGELLLRGAALAAPLVSWCGPVVTRPRVVPGPPPRDALAWPPAGLQADARERFVLPDAEVADAALFGLLADDTGAYHIVGASRSADGAFALPPRVDGDAWLLLVARDHAAQAWPWSTVVPGSTLTLARGQPLVVEVRDENGLPVVDLAVEYRPDRQAAAGVAAHTDAFGRATFGRVLGPGTLLVSDARYLNQTIELDRVPIAPLAVAVAAGGEVRGRVGFAGDPVVGRAPATIAISLRDSFGVLRPAQRTTLAAADGTFRFGGLPDDRDLLVFATAQRNGRTWSGRAFVRAGDTEVELLLQNEDPQLLPGTGR